MFLTLEDPRAKVQGSRDPLGTLPAWYWFGRRLVGNLTTVSNSVRGFTTLLIARYYTEQLVNDGRVSEEDALSLFLRFEQVAAYARHVGQDVQSEIRGIERVKRALSEHGSRVPIGVVTGAILSDQKTYGLWGLYSVPARASGMITDGHLGVTPYAQEFARSEYGRTLKKVETDVAKIMSSDGWFDTQKNRPLCAALTSIFSPSFTPSEVEFYGEVLRDGVRAVGLPSSRQATVANLLAEHTDLQEPIGREDVEVLQSRAAANDPGLARRLERIARLEALLAPAAVIFGYLQTKHGQRPADLALQLKERWGSAVPHLETISFSEIFSEVEGQLGTELTLVMKQADDTLATGAYEETISSLLEWNRLVMKNRGAAPWLRLDANGKLDVRYRAVEETLPDGDELPTLWRNSYFLNSLKDVTAELQAVR